MTERVGTLSFLRTEWRFLLFGLLISFWSGPGQTFAIALFGGEIRADFGLSHGDFGLIFTLATLASAMILWKTGPLVDRYALLPFALSAALIMVVAIAVFSFAAGPISLFFAILFVRFMGQGMMAHIAVTAMGKRFVRERGRAIAFAGLGMPIAQAVMPFAIVAALGIMNWPVVWLILGGAAAVMLLGPIPLLLRNLPDRTRPAHLNAASNADTEPNIRQWTRGEMLRDPRFYLMCALPTAFAAVLTGVFFHQVHIVAVKGWSMEWWSICFAVFAVVNVVTGIGSGLLIDRVGAKAIAPYCGLPLAVGLVMLSGLNDPYWAVVILALIGMTVGSVMPTTSALWAEIYGTDHLGAIRSVVSVAMVFASAFGPVIVGWAFDADISMIAIMITCAAIMILSDVSAYMGVKKTPISAPS